MLQPDRGWPLLHQGSEKPPQSPLCYTGPGNAPATCRASFTSAPAALVSLTLEGVDTETEGKGGDPMGSPGGLWGNQPLLPWGQDVNSIARSSDPGQ